MQVNGYDIKEAIKEWTDEVQSITSEFNDSIYKFKDEEKASPITCSEKYIKAFERLVKLQSLQQLYNMNQIVTIKGESPITLCEAIKKISFIDRMKNMWKSVAIKDDSSSLRYNSYAYNKLQRPSDVELAIKQIDSKDAKQLSKNAARYSSELRLGISASNAQKVELGVGIYKDFSDDLFSES